jgi:hypothetical protein
MEDDNSPEKLRSEIERLRQVARFFSDRRVRDEIAKMIAELEHRLSGTE